MSVRNKTTGLYHGYGPVVFVAFCKQLWYAMVLSLRRAGSPLRFFEGGDTMYITLSDLIQMGILVVNIIALFFQVSKKEK